jgi:LuxR family maltose regulon positive regulatory protein
MINFKSPDFDVEKLDSLLSSGNFSQLKQELLLILKYSSGIDWIFLLDKYIFSFPEEEILKTPQFITFAAVSASIKGNIGKATKYAQLLDNNLLLSHYVNAYMPFTDNKTFRNSVLYLKSTPNFHATFSSNRPSIINSIRDYSTYIRLIEHIEKPLKKTLYEIYGNKSIGMYEVALAEYYYQVNRCYDALALVDSVMGDLQRCGNPYVLQAALYVQISVFIMKGQSKKLQPLIDDFEYKISVVNYSLYPNYIDALRAWCALYEGDYDYCENWINTTSKQEIATISIMDIYNILVGLRVYLLLKKYYLLISVAIRLIPLLESWHRTMDICEVKLLYAMALFSDENFNQAYAILDEVLPLVRRYHYHRLVANEGQIMYHMLRLYKKSRHIINDEFMEMLISLTKATGIMYPNYLQKHSVNYAALTDTERSVLRLMADERTNADIADYMSISINTVKFHSKNIFSKLNVSNRHQAIKIAIEANII